MEKNVNNSVKNIVFYNSIINSTRVANMVDDSKNLLSKIQFPQKVTFTDKDHYFTSGSWTFIESMNSASNDSSDRLRMNPNAPCNEFKMNDDILNLHSFETTKRELDTKEDDDLDKTSYCFPFSNPASSSNTNIKMNKKGFEKKNTNHERNFGFENTTLKINEAFSHPSVTHDYLETPKYAQISSGIVSKDRLESSCNDARVDYIYEPKKVSSINSRFEDLLFSKKDGKTDHIQSLNLVLDDMKVLGEKGNFPASYQESSKLTNLKGYDCHLRQHSDQRSNIIDTKSYENGDDSPKGRRVIKDKNLSASKNSHNTIHKIQDEKFTLGRALNEFLTMSSEEGSPKNTVSLNIPSKICTEIDRCNDHKDVIDKDQEINLNTNLEESFSSFCSALNDSKILNDSDQGKLQSQGHHIQNKFLKKPIEYNLHSETAVKHLIELYAAKLNVECKKNKQLESEVRTMRSELLSLRRKNAVLHQKDANNLMRIVKGGSENHKSISSENKDLSSISVNENRLAKIDSELKVRNLQSQMLIQENKLLLFQKALKIAQETNLRLFDQNETLKRYLTNVMSGSESQMKRIDNLSNLTVLDWPKNCTSELAEICSNKMDKSDKNLLIRNCVKDSEAYGIIEDKNTIIEKNQCLSLSKDPINSSKIEVENIKINDKSKIHDCNNNYLRESSHSTKTVLDYKKDHNLVEKCVIKNNIHPGDPISFEFNITEKKDDTKIEKVKDNKQIKNVEPPDHPSILPILGVS